MLARPLSFLSLCAALCCSAVIPLSTSLAANEPAKPQLALDAGGHTSTIKKIAFLPNGREVVTVGEDKSIRFWDVQTGEALRTLRPSSGFGDDGRLYALAVSPNGEFMAVGGLFDGNDNPILLISLTRFEIVKVLLGHTNVIHDLVFSPDSQKLLSGAGDNNARIWNVATGQSERELKGHTKDIYGVCFSPDGRFCVTAAYDKTAIVWQVATGGQVGVLRGHTAEVKQPAWSPDGRTIATCAKDKTIRLWNPPALAANGPVVVSARHTFDKLGDHSISSVTFGPDSVRLLYTHGIGPTQDLAGVINIQTGIIESQFAEHNNTIMMGALSPDGKLAVTIGGNDEDTYVWNSATGARVAHFRSRGKVNWSAAWSADGKKIAWGTTSRGNSRKANHPLERTFDLSLLEFGGAPDDSFQRARMERAGTSLQVGAETAVNVIRDGKAIATLQPTYEYDKEYDGVRSFSFLPGERAIVGSNWSLKLYDTRTGERQKTFLGHTGTVWAVSPSPDGRYFLSAGGDMTLRVWTPNADFPILSLFFADDDWIAWTPEGYYAASPGGERLMGWQVNNGRERMATFHPANQFRKSLYRPDVIMKLLEAGSVERALEMVGAKSVEVSAVLPPVITITSPDRAAIETTRDEVAVRCVATQVGQHPIVSLQLLIDDRPATAADGKVTFRDVKPERRHEFRVPLPRGRASRVSVRADSSVSYAVSAPVEVTVKAENPEDAPTLPSLYILAIGPTYARPELALRYNQDDARAVVKAFQEHSQQLYKKIDTKMLIAQDASQRGILSGLRWLKQQMTQHDIAVFFYSGHGSKDEQGKFYLMPSDCDPDDLLATAVSDDSVKHALQAIPGRLMVMLDACHAGDIGKNRRKNVVSLTDDLVRDLSNDDYGLIAMASSMGREFSQESNDHRAGFFTVALVEGLSGKADINGDSVVYLTELDNYVSERVKDLSRGEQHPVTSKPTTVRSFPLSRFKK